MPSQKKKFVKVPAELVERLYKLLDKVHKAQSISHPLNHETFWCLMDLMERTPSILADNRRNRRQMRRQRNRIDWVVPSSRELALGAARILAYDAWKYLPR